MPMVTAAALDSLILGRQSGDPSSRTGGHFSMTTESQPRPHPFDAPTGVRGENQSARRKLAASPSPSLYTTPKEFFISADASPSDFLSPYVVDHKGRGRERGPSPLTGPSVAENGTRGTDGDVEVEKVPDKEGDKGEEPQPIANNRGGGDAGDTANGLRIDETEDTADNEDDEFDDDYFDSRLSLRSASFSEAESSSSARRVPFRRRDPGAASFTSNSEYYDAGDEFGSSDSPAERPSRRLEDMELELRSMRLGLFEEIEKRARAEESLANLRNRWNGIATGLSAIGLSSFPTVPKNGEDTLWESEDTAELVGREILTTRAVSEAIARDVGRAEAEESVGVAVEAKNREIARLRERLNYYEAVNHEMSQRNLEIAEQSRRRRQRRKVIRRFLWGSVSFTVVVGASLLAYNYMPQSHSTQTSSLPSNKDVDAASD